MLSVLNAGNWAEQYSTIGERAFLSVTMTLVGIAIVVFILALLTVVVSLMSRLINGKKKEAAETQVPAEPASVAADEPAGSGVDEDEEDTDDSETDDALIAAISAAVSVMLSDSGQPSAGFKIRRIRRV